MLTSTRTRLWEMMLDADMNARYWGYLARRYQSYDQWIKVGVAVTGTSAFVSVIGRVPVLAAIFAVGTAGVAAALFQLNFPLKVERMATLQGRWSELQFGFNRLWSRIDIETDQSVDAALTALESKVVEVKKDETKLPYDSKILKRRQAEVLISRGLR